MHAVSILRQKPTDLFCYNTATTALTVQFPLNDVAATIDVADVC